HVALDHDDPGPDDDHDAPGWGLWQRAQSGDVRLDRLPVGGAAGPPADDAGPRGIRPEARAEHREGEGYRGSGSALLRGIRPEAHAAAAEGGNSRPDQLRAPVERARGAEEAPAGAAAGVPRGRRTHRGRPEEPHARREVPGRRAGDGLTP